MLCPQFGVWTFSHPRRHFPTTGGLDIIAYIRKPIGPG